MAVQDFPRCKARPHAAPSVLGWLARVWENRRQRAELLSLTERELRDIGVTRYDALKEARKSIWR